jgi:predicted transcriptional regulator
LNAQIQVPPSELLMGKEQGKVWNAINGSKRGQIEIIAEILHSCLRGKAKTRIMYANNLNYAQLQNNLKLLTSRSLLMLKNGKYVTTEKGFVFLELFAGIRDILQNGES